MPMTEMRRKRFDPFLLSVFLGTVLFTGLMAGIIWTIPFGQASLTAEVALHQNESGVESAVTAVLLNFRGYDTMLEVMVLLLAVIGVWSMTEAPFPRKKIQTSTIQLGIVRLIAPLMCLVAFYLVWQGSHLAGGAFQGGAVLGGAVVLMLVSELPWLKSVPSLPLRAGLLIGPFIFLGIALWCLVSEGTLLAYPENASALLLVIIETACALSIGLTLAALFAGGRPKDDLRKAKKRAGNK